MKTKLKFPKVGTQIGFLASANGAGVKKMVEAYHVHPKKLEDSSGETLNGLVVDVSDIVALYQENNVDKYMILFAVSEEDVDKDKPQQDITAVLAPIIDGAISTEGLRNKFSPCPSSCYNYNDIFDLP